MCTTDGHVVVYCITLASDYCGKNRGQHLRSFKIVAKFPNIDIEFKYIEEKFDTYNGKIVIFFTHYQVVIILTE